MAQQEVAKLYLELIINLKLIEIRKNLNSHLQIQEKLSLTIWINVNFIQKMTNKRIQSDYKFFPPSIANSKEQAHIPTNQVWILLKISNYYRKVVH